MARQNISMPDDLAAQGELAGSLAVYAGSTGVTIVSTRTPMASYVDRARASRVTSMASCSLAAKATRPS